MDQEREGPVSGDSGDKPWPTTRHYPLFPTSTSIRLFILSPGNRSDQIHGKLIVVDLEEKPEFEALSYEWGLLGDASERILMGSAEMNVGGNLHYALTELRKQYNNRALWIDALCIDQGHNQERNHQVGLMGRIYSQAERVLVWLGPKSGNSDVAMEILKVCETYSNRSQVPDETEQSIENAKALQHLFNRSYWDRIWIVQEIMLAKDVYLYCGTRFASWKALKHATKPMSKLSNYSDLSPQPLRRVPECLAAYLFRNKAPTQELGNQRRQHTNLRYWLRICSESVSSEPRDVIYGLLSLANDRHQIQVDYSKTIYEVYKDIVNWYKTDMDIFRFSSDIQARIPIFPVPVQDPLEKEFWIPGLLDGIIQASEDYPDELNSPFMESELDRLMTRRFRKPLPEGLNFKMLLHGTKEIDVIKVSLLARGDKQISSDITSILALQDTGMQLVKVQKCVNTPDMDLLVPLSVRLGDRICWFQHSPIALVLRQSLNTGEQILVGRALVYKGNYPRRVPSWADPIFQDLNNNCNDIPASWQGERERRREVIGLKLDSWTLQKLSEL